jgi:hypothetical protein
VRTRPEFTPGQRVSVDWTLRTGRSLFVPPMSEVRYEFELTDDTGATFTTPRRTVTYSDPRFQWRTLNVDGIELWYYNTPDDRARREAEDARNRVRRMEELFGASLAGTVRGVVYNGRDIQSALSFRSDTTSAEGHFGGEAYTDIRLFTISGIGAAGVTHEVTHVLLGDALGRGKFLVPSWLNEGLAQYAEGPAAMSRTFTRALRLHQMGGVPSRAADVSLHYQQGHSVVTFLIQNYGDDAMRTFLREIGRAQSIDEAARTAYGTDLTGIENQWRERVGLPQVGPPEPRGPLEPPAARPQDPEPPVVDAPDVEQPLVQQAPLDANVWVLAAALSGAMAVAVVVSFGISRLIRR